MGVNFIVIVFFVTIGTAVEASRKEKCFLQVTNSKNNHVADTVKVISYKFSKFSVCPPGWTYLAGTNKCYFVDVVSEEWRL
jgi:hypothetical protein